MENKVQIAESLTGLPPVGTVVILRSSLEQSGPLMTVSGLNQAGYGSGDSGIVVCLWFDRQDHIQEGSFPPKTLLAISCAEAPLVITDKAMIKET